MSEQQSTPREDGFSMPAEWEPHEASLMEWPIPLGLIEIPRLVRCGREAGYLRRPPTSIQRSNSGRPRPSRRA
jgi:hypothetical protein